MLMAGTPSPLLLPAGSYKFEDHSGLLELTIPIRGEFPEDYPRKGSFDLNPDSNVFLFGTMVEVLFAMKKYPSLMPEQRFIISGFEINGDELTLVGRIVKQVTMEQ